MIGGRPSPRVTDGQELQDDLGQAGTKPWGKRGGRSARGERGGGAGRHKLKSRTTLWKGKVKADPAGTAEERGIHERRRIGATNLERKKSHTGGY